MHVIGHIQGLGCITIIKNPMEKNIAMNWGCMGVAGISFYQHYDSFPRSAVLWSYTLGSFKQ